MSSLLAESDPELSALLALQSIDASARAGIPATAETEEALHWALQAARVAYPVAEALIEVRSGPHGLTGIYWLPLDELVALAKSQLVTRALTAEECQRYGITPGRTAPRGRLWRPNRAGRMFPTKGNRSPGRRSRWSGRLHRRDS